MVQIQMLHYLYCAVFIPLTLSLWLLLEAAGFVIGVAALAAKAPDVAAVDSLPMSHSIACISKNGVMSRD